jgi:hypothetical protein
MCIRESPVGESTADHEWKSEIASLGRCTGQATYDRAQFGLLHLFRCFFGRDPLGIIGGVGFGVRTEAESRMRTECRETTGTGGDTIIEERERPVERR